VKGIGFYDKDFFVIKQDHDLVSESITRIIMTNWNERVGRPFFGVDLKPQMFEQLDDESIRVIENNIKNQLGDYEPRATIENVTISTDIDNNTFSVQIAFKLIGDQIGDARFINLTYNLEQ
jgi:phage baseplate assembly protein W